MAKQLKMDNVYVSVAGEEMMRGLDENSVYWYLWNEVCNILLIPSRAKTDIFNNCVNEYEYGEFAYGNDLCDIFISTDAFVRIVNRNNERANDIIKEIINNENRPNKFEKSELDMRFEKIKNILDKPGLPNYVDVCMEVKEIWYLDEYRDIMDKYDKTFDKDIENAVDGIRNYLYEKEVKEILGVDEENEIKFKFNVTNNFWN